MDNKPGLIFDLSNNKRTVRSLAPQGAELDEASNLLPEHLRRKNLPDLPQVGELQVVRHYTRLSQQNFSIDTHFYPLGSCTIIIK